MKKYAIIIGAGPAGLTAAHELSDKTDIKPLIFEYTSQIGGISKTINYKGNRIDIGGHRFFSKSDRIVEWWLKFLPLQIEHPYDELLLETVIQYSYLDEVTQIEDRIGGDGKIMDSFDSINLMLIRKRLSRIFFNSKFFDYPITLNRNTIFNLGLSKIIKIALSYIKSKIHPKNENSLENFFINRFGKELYQTFFKDYTKKVWGVPCEEIKPEWGSQRIKGLSITKTVKHSLNQILSSEKSINQKNVETSLIEQFMYPKLGPGQLWENVANHILQNGAKINYNNEVCELICKDNRITGVIVKNKISGEYETHKADYVISSMPVKDLIEAINLSTPVPSNVRNIAKNLQYRDFITVGILLKKLKLKNQTNDESMDNLIPDNWIYIQEKSVKLGRLQIFNNWSPYMVKDPNNVWLGLEYFCNEGDNLWSKTDNQMMEFAINELHELGFIDKNDVLDGVVIKVPKAYPAYFGSYDNFDIIKNFTDTIENLFLIGRNGMHRYNNMDHSMLTAMEAVKNIIHGKKTKDNIWNINSEEEYHEMTNKNL